MESESWISRGIHTRPRTIGLLLAATTVAYARTRGMDQLRDATRTLRADIERHKIVEADLSRAKAELEEAARVRIEFIAGISHALRTPLASILGYTEMLADGEVGELTAPQAKLLEVVDRNAHQMAELLEDMFLLSRLGLALPDASNRVDVIELVNHVMQTMTSSIEDRDLSLIATVDGDVGEVSADRNQIERVLRNLLANAVEYTPDGGAVTVSASRAAEHITLTVVDTGMGIDVQDQMHVFEPFFRSIAAQCSTVQGAGLGLATARSIVEAHGGGISLVSQPGAGTSVIVRLPVRRGQQGVGNGRQSVGAKT